jgi:hypothetical protein
VYLSYECPSVPAALLQRFHDHLSIQQALARYAGDPALRSLYTLQANDPGLWESVMQTAALTEDLAGADSGLEGAVGTGVAALARLLDRWESLLASSDLAALAQCNTAAIVDSLDRAAASGQSYLDAYAAALADGRVTVNEAGDVDEKMALWKLDLMALQGVMAESFEQLGEVHRRASSPKERPLRDTAEQMLRLLTPWLTGEPDDLGLWVLSSPTYLEQAIESLQDFPTDQISVP